MEVAPRYTQLTLFTLLTLFNTAFTVYIIQTALHRLTNSMYAYILLGEVRRLLEWADALLSKMLGDWMDGMEWMDTPLRMF